MALTAPPELVVGVDVGGSGIKGALVDLTRGELAGERHRISTPRPAIPEAIADVITEVVAHVGHDGRVGCTLPGVVQQGVVRRAPNLSPLWDGLDARTLLGRRLGRPVTVVNDADAAGLAEARFGAGRDVKGVVIVVTLGTGIGTAIVTDGQLVPNTELGHLRMGKKEAEQRASNRTREQHGLSWKKWGKRVSAYLEELERLFWPQLFVLGGGVSKDFAKFGPRLDVRTLVLPARLGNQAGIIGAALVAAT